MSNVSSSNSHKELVPKLRFKGFSDEWATTTLGEIGTFTKGAPLSKADISDVGTPFILYGELYTTYKEIATEIVRCTLKTVDDECLSRVGDVIIPTSGETPEEIATATCVMLPDVILAGDLNIYRNSTVDGRIISYIINHVINGEISRIAQGKSVVHIKADELAKMQIRYPTRQEQNRIIDFLTLLDKKIEKQQSLIAAFKSYKRGLIFSIFSKDNNSGISMTLTPLYNLLTEYRVRDTKDLRVCSVAVNKGIVDQIEHLGRSFSATDTSNYGRVKVGDIVYTKSPTGDFPYGIVKQNKLNEVVAVSPLYGVYTPKTFDVGNLLHYYFEQHENANNYIRPLAQKGAKNTINITNQTFLQGMILFPNNGSDCARLCTILNAIEQNIIKQENFLRCLQQQKKWLLQKIFI